MTDTDRSSQRSSLRLRLHIHGNCYNNTFLNHQLYKLLGKDLDRSNIIRTDHMQHNIEDISLCRSCLPQDIPRTLDCSSDRLIHRTLRSRDRRSELGCFASAQSEVTGCSGWLHSNRQSTRDYTKKRRRTVKRNMVMVFILIFYKL